MDSEADNAVKKQDRKGCRYESKNLQCIGKPATGNQRTLLQVSKRYIRFFSIFFIGIFALVKFLLLRIMYALVGTYG